jgi:hypothetical protein
MALLFADHFVDGILGSYDCYWDTGTNAGVVHFVGAGSPKTFIAIPNSDRGYSEGDFIVATCNLGDKYNFYATAATPFVTCTIDHDSPDCTVTPGCDLIINSLTVTNESDTGENDGQVTINASSSAPIQYSLDGSTWVSTNHFGSLTPGNYTAYVKDTGPCTAQQAFTIAPFSNPVQQFTDDLPVVEYGGNISKWNAVFNPIVVKFQRKDFVVTSIVSFSPTQIKVILSTTLTTEQQYDAIHGGIYLKSDKYDFYGLADSYSSGLIITTAYLGTDTAGWVNLISEKQAYRIQLEITNGDNPTNPNIIVAEYSPNNKGATRADIAVYLRAFLSAEETYDFLTTNYRDANLAGSFTLRYREVWADGNSPWFSAPYPMYYTFAARQLGDFYGGNMAEYVPFLTVTANKYKAKWLTGFVKPTFFNGLPFEIAFIYSEDIIDKELTAEIIPNCGAPTNELLLNADATFLLNADLSRFIINKVYNPDVEGFPVIAQLGVNRLLIPAVFDCCADSVKINLFYLEGEDKVYVMQDQYFKLDCPCDNDPYVYVKWINKLGAWDYWRFGYNQTTSAIVSGSQQITRYVQDWERDQTINDFISRKGNRKLALVCGNLEAQEYDALMWMCSSIKVQIMTGVNPIRWQTVIIADGDVAGIQTRKGKGNFKVTIMLPDLNIQGQ